MAKELIKNTLLHKDLREISFPYISYLIYQQIFTKFFVELYITKFYRIISGIWFYSSRKKVMAKKLIKKSFLHNDLREISLPKISYISLEPIYMKFCEELYITEF